MMQVNLPLPGIRRVQVWFFGLMSDPALMRFSHRAGAAPFHNDTPYAVVIVMVVGYDHPPQPFVGGNFLIDDEADVGRRSKPGP